MMMMHFSIYCSHKHQMIISLVLFLFVLSMCGIACIVVIFFLAKLHIVVDCVDKYAPASYSWARPGGGGPRCPGLGSPGLALGGVTFWGVRIGEDSGSRRRPGSDLVAADGATPIWGLASEAAGPRVGDMSPYQGRGRARPSLLVRLRHELQQHLVVHSEGSEP